MKSGRLELVRGSGNVFRDLDREELTVRTAHARTGFAAADFSRIRTADLARFTADRLMSILNCLGSRVEVKIRVRPGESIKGELRA